MNLQYSMENFVSIISYHDKNLQRSFDSKVSGTISKKITGKGWGYDPIFIPQNFNETFAKIPNKNKNHNSYNNLKQEFHLHHYNHNLHYHRKLSIAQTSLYQN